MIRYHAAWILPIGEPPIRDGWVAVDRGRVVALGSAGRRVLARRRARRRSRRGRDPARPRQRAHAPRAVVPARRGAAGVRVRDLDSRRDRRAAPASRSARRRDPRRGRSRASPKRSACGTAVVGDISNTLVTFDPLTRSPLAGVVFYELIRFNAPDPAGFVEQRDAARSTRSRRPIACASAWPRTRRIRWRRWCCARSAARSIAVRSRRAASTCRSRWRRSSSSAPAAGRGARCSRSSAPGIRRGCRRAARRCSISTRAAFSTRACSPSTACR